jgi:hypothetical protein
MELTTTLIIKFVLSVQIILTLFFAFLKFAVKVNFVSIADLFHESQNFICFLFANPRRRLCK